MFGGGRAQRGRSSGDGPVGPPKVLILGLWLTVDYKSQIAERNVFNSQILFARFSRSSTLTFFQGRANHEVQAVN